MNIHLPVIWASLGYQGFHSYPYNSYITSMNSYQVISLMSLKYHNHDVFGVENASGCHTRGEA